MSYYRIVFVKNKIVSCIETIENEASGKKIPYCEHHNGLLNFVIVKADSESQARSQAKYMALELKQKKELNY